MSEHTAHASEQLEPTTVPEIPAPSIKVPEVKPKAPHTHLNAEQRRDRAKLAADRRWKAEEKLKAQAQHPESFDWENAPMEDAEKFLAHLRAEAERASGILQRRASSIRLAEVNCIVCNALIQPGRWAMQKQRKNPATGLYYNIFYCTQRCVALENLEKQKVNSIPR